MKYLLLTLLALIFSGCTAVQLNNGWERTKTASYNAITDEVTWGAALAATTLYATGYDSDITDHLMEHSVVEKEDDTIYRNINQYETIATALFIEDDSYETKGKRVFAEVLGMNVAKGTTTFLSTHIDRESPGGSHNGAIGSHHALDHFASSAMNRRNVERMNIPEWGKYTLNTISYATATASALSRVQDGGHSFADQLVSVSIGNFIGLFFHDVFMLDPTTNIGVSQVNSDTKITLNFSY